MASEVATATPVRGDGPGLLRAIGSRLPGLRLLTEPSDRESYRRDETAYLTAGLPLAVALPTTSAEVVELVRLCGEFAGASMIGPISVSDSAGSPNPRA